MTPEELEQKAGRRHFVLRKLHSLSGIVPVGLFLCVHLFTNAKAIQGSTCFGHAVAEINHLPFLPAVEIFGIFLPLAFHAGFGVVLATQAKANVGSYGYGRNWLYVFQRVTAWITLLFIIVHLKDFRVAKALGMMHYPEFYNQLSSMLGVRWRALLYLFGTTAAVFHFANGLRTFLFSWGVTVSQRSQRWAAIATAALGVGLWFIGVNTLLFFATGGGTFVPSSLTRGEGGRDMCEDALEPTAPSGASSGANASAAGGAPIAH